LQKHVDTLAGTQGAQLKSKDQELAALRKQVEELKKGGGERRVESVREESRGQELSIKEAREIMSRKRPGVDWSTYEDDDVINWALPYWEMDRGGGSNVTELRETVEQMKAHTAFDRFCMAVEKMAPGFMVAQGNPYDDIAGDPGWVAFLNEPLMAGATQTRGEWLMERGTSETTARMFKDYQARGGEKPVPFQRSILPTIEGQVALVGSTGRSSVSEGKRYSRVEVEAFRHKLQTKQIPYTHENQQLLREYQIAQIEGRLD
jgi:hypothetical protein